MTTLLCLIILFSNLCASNLETTLNKLTECYSRPITILYAANNPSLLNLNKKNTTLYWSQSEQLIQTVRNVNATNLLIACAEYTEENFVSLSKCEHFDIAIIDLINQPTLTSKIKDGTIHLADHTFIQERFRPLFRFDKDKTILKNNWWKSGSDHKNYPITSNFSEKYFIKPGEYRKAKTPKKYPWIHGINLCTFMNLNGKFPSLRHIRERVIESLDPIAHLDFGWANIIIQGQTLQPIDYDDTTYGESAYRRLERTLEFHLKTHYKGKTPCDS